VQAMFQPSEQPTEYSDVKVGDSVKIKNIQGESFWVTVADVLHDGNFTGTVDNHLVLGSDYNFGDIVSFKEEHIRGHKNTEIKKKQKLFLSLVIHQLSSKLQRKPTVEELDYFLTNAF